MLTVSFYRQGTFVEIFALPLFGLVVLIEYRLTVLVKLNGDFEAWQIILFARVDHYIAGYMLRFLSVHIVKQLCNQLRIYPSAPNTIGFIT